MLVHGALYICVLCVYIYSSVSEIQSVIEISSRTGMFVQFVKIRFT